VLREAVRRTGLSTAVPCRAASPYAARVHHLEHATLQIEPDTHTGYDELAW